MTSSCRVALPERHVSLAPADERARSTGGVCEQDASYREDDSHQQREKDERDRDERKLASPYQPIPTLCFQSMAAEASTWTGNHS